MSKYNKAELEDESEDLFNPDRWEVQSDEDFSDEEEEEGDYQVEFYSDEDSDSDESDVKSEGRPSKFNKEAHLKKLNDRYKQSLIECYLALEGKLKWAEFKLEPPPPFEPEEVNRTKKNRVKAPKVKKWIKTSDIDIIIDDDLGVCFVWKIQKSTKPCKYLVEGKECPFGPKKCYHKHDPPPKEKKPQLCKYIKEEKPCPFKAYCLYQHEIIQKDRLCKYFKNHMACPYKDRCMYKHEFPKPAPSTNSTTGNSLKYKPEGLAICKHASKCKMNLAGKCKFLHLRKDIKNYMKPCPRGENCDGVKLSPKKLVNKNGQQISYYKNIDGGCGFVHPQEELDSFAYRMIK